MFLQDTDVQQPTTTPHKLKPGERGNVLTAKRPAKDDGPEVPLALFEPFDPTKKAMYAKQLVYQVWPLTQLFSTSNYPQQSCKF